MNTALGAGMLALPFAFKNQGIMLCIFNISLCALLTGLGLILQGFISGFLTPRKSSFYAASQATFPKLSICLDLAIAFKCFGVCVSYLVIVGDLMPLITDYFGYETSRKLWLLVAMVMVTPISFLRSLSSLRMVSVIALSSVVYLVIVVMGHLIANDTKDLRGEIAVFKPASAQGVITTIPIIVFAFTCAQNMFASINEMRSRNMKTIVKIAINVVSICAVVYISVGLAGYLSFGNNVGDNIIAMYNLSVWTTLGRFAIVVLVVFSYPLMFHPARSSIENVMYGHDAGIEEENELERLMPHESEQENRKHVALTVFLLILTFLLATFLNSLEMILSLVGATGATGVSFILPGIMAYILAKSDRENNLVSLPEYKLNIIKYLSLGLFTWGVVVAVLAVCINLSRILA